MDLLSELANPNEYERVVKLKINRRDSWMGASPSSGGEQAGCQRVAALPPQQGDGACGLHCIFHPLMRITMITLVQSNAASEDPPKLRVTLSVVTSVAF